MKVYSNNKVNIFSQAALVAEVEAAYKAILAGNCQKGMGAYIRIIKANLDFEKALLAALIKAKGGN